MERQGESREDPVPKGRRAHPHVPSQHPLRPQNTLNLFDLVGPGPLDTAGGPIRPGPVPTVDERASAVNLGGVDTLSAEDDEFSHSVVNEISGRIVMEVGISCLAGGPEILNQASASLSRPLLGLLL